MFNTLLAVFGIGRKKEPESRTDFPAPGQKWVLKGDSSPWPKKKYPPVTILDTTDKWVRYGIEDLIFSDGRLEMDSFLRCYKPHS